jgi:PilZ domain
MMYGAMGQGRRQTSWYTFFAHAELLVENFNVCLTTRVSKLSRQGCDLQLRDTFPVGTSVVVRVYAWPHFFQASGTVCYSDQRFGVGVAFEKIEPDYAALDACLLEAEQNESKNFE